MPTSFMKMRSAGPALLIFMKLIGMAALLIAGIKPLF